MNAAYPHYVDANKRKIYMETVCKAGIKYLPEWIQLMNIEILVMGLERGLKMIQSAEYPVPTSMIDFIDSTSSSTGGDCAVIPVDLTSLVLQLGLFGEIYYE